MIHLKFSPLKLTNTVLRARTFNVDIKTLFTNLILKQELCLRIHLVTTSLLQHRQLLQLLQPLLPLEGL